MSTLRTYNVQSSDSASTNIQLTENGGIIVAGISTFSNNLIADGRIGIGTDNPTQALTLRGEQIIETNSTAADSGNGIYWQSTTNGWNTGQAHAAIFGKRVDANNGYFRIDVREGGTTSEKLRITSTGNVGIGTDNPQTRLHIDGASNGQSRITISRSGFLRNNFIGIDGDADELVIAADEGNEGPASHIRFKVDGTEKLRITSSGRIGIGSESPSDPLDIADNDPAIRLTDIDGQVYHRIRSSSQDLLIECDDGAVGAKPNLRFQVGNDEKFRVTGVGGSFGIGTNDPQTRFHVNATIDDNDAPQWAFHLTQDDPLNSFNQVGGTGIGILFKPATNSDPAIGAGIAAEKPGASDDDTTTDLVFYTSNNDEVLDERLRVKSNGTVYMASGGILAIGAETAQMSSTGNVRVTGDFYNGASGIALNTTDDTNNAVFIDFGNSSGTRVGEIDRASSTTVAYRTSSDYRLKENVVPFTDGIERVKRLNPVRYSWIADEKTEADQDGFLAHEVQDVVPIATGGTKDQVDADGNIVPQGIDHSLLVPLLTAALQEALDKIETLEQRLTDAGL